jgi:hypothetical protein
MILAVAFETTELVAVAVGFVSEATGNVTTPLTDVLWRNLLDGTLFGSLAEYVDGDAIDEAMDRCAGQVQ